MPPKADNVLIASTMPPTTSRSHAAKARASFWRAMVQQACPSTGENDVKGVNNARDEAQHRQQNVQPEGAGKSDFHEYAQRRKKNGEDDLENIRESNRHDKTSRSMFGWIECNPVKAMRMDSFVLTEAAAEKSRFSVPESEGEPASEGVRTRRSG